jgi:hypothetical protein
MALQDAHNARKGGGTHRESDQEAICEASCMSTLEIFYDPVDINLIKEYSHFR